MRVGQGSEEWPMTGDLASNVDEVKANAAEGKLWISKKLVAEAALLKAVGEELRR